MAMFEVRGDSAAGHPLFVTKCQSIAHRDIEISAAKKNPAVSRVRWRDLDKLEHGWAEV